MSPEDYMHKALELARLGLGRTRPNPAVGCVIVKAGRIVGQGYHQQAGHDHAEIVALKQAGKQASGADVYVTLEPCAHYGRTPPCTDALIAAGIKRIFVGMLDPHPKVSGRGLKQLKAAGIEVHLGVLKTACVQLNEAFITYVKKHRPYVIAKWAQSLDGKIATRLEQSQWITGKKARAYGHTLRNVADGILVGIETILKDNPKLTCRAPKGRDPIRIVLDTHARTPINAQILKVKSKAPTWIVVGPKANLKKRALLQQHGAEIIVCKTKNNRIDVKALMSLLYERELLAVLIEGGPTVLGSFFDASIVDKVYAFIAPKVIGGLQARSAILGEGAGQLLHAPKLKQTSLLSLEEDFLISGYIHEPRL